MFVYQELLARQAESRPVRVGLIGAGKFGSMFLSQVPTTPGLRVAVIADLNPDAARAACRNVGWSDVQVAGTRFTDDSADLLSAADVDVVVEATGNPSAGIRHARGAFAKSKHIVMVNVEADVLAGALLAEEATAKLGTPVAIDVMRPLQAFDAGGRARALTAIVQAMSQAKEAGLEPAQVQSAFGLVDWKE